MCNVHICTYNINLICAEVCIYIPILLILKGLYIFADYVSGRIWSLDTRDPQKPINTELLNADFPISSFGVDQNQELYICGFDDKIYKLSYE